MAKSHLSVVFLLLFMVPGTDTDAQSLNENDLYAISNEGVNLSDELSGVSDFNGRTSGWWTRRYLIDYAIVTAGITGYAIGKDLEPRSSSMFGPSYDPDNLLDLFDSEQVNRTYLEQDAGETVPEYHIHRAIALSGGFLLGMEWREHRNGRGSPQQIHQTFFGFAEAVAVNAAATELLKPVFSRLRPDFRERALRFHCPDMTSSQYDRFCEDYRDQPLVDDPGEAQNLLDDGRKSFYSGHSSNSFAIFSYTSLAIGGRYVWGEHASSRSRTLGITAQAAALSYATYISASRVSDGRHFVSDTIVGATVGTAIANLSYWRRFYRTGEVRGSRPDDNSRSFAVQPWGGTGSGGLSLNLEF
jgi:membrane-associated phospholipid phosphatase